MPRSCCLKWYLFIARERTNNTMLPSYWLLSQLMSCISILLDLVTKSIFVLYFWSLILKYFLPKAIIILIICWDGTFIGIRIFVVRIKINKRIIQCISMHKTKVWSKMSVCIVTKLDGKIIETLNNDYILVNICINMINARICKEWMNEIITQ